MSRRLEEIHRRLRADHVPCLPVVGPDGERAIRAGLDAAHPVSRWAVVISETPGRLWLHQGDDRVAVPYGTDETTVATAVKLRVVHGWAEQGDTDAADALRRARMLVDRQHTGPRPGSFPMDPFALPADTVFRVFEMAFRMSWGLTLMIPGPWGIRMSFTVRR